MTRRDPLGLLFMAACAALGSGCSSSVGAGGTGGHAATPDSGSAGGGGGMGGSFTMGQGGTTSSGGASAGGSPGVGGSAADAGVADARGRAGADGGADSGDSGGTIAQPPGNPVTFSTSRLVGVASGLCLGVVGASTANNAAVELEPCNGSVFQSWTAAQDAAGYATVTNAGSGKCLDVTGASTAAGTILQQYNCSGNDNQKWRITDTGGQKVAIQSKWSGLVVDVRGGGVAAGTPVVQTAWSAARSQLWTASLDGPNRGPCDIYQSGGTPCVAAHSTVRALYAAYNGRLYQVRRASDNTTKDIPTIGAGDFVNIAVQDAFCASTTCTIPIIYDQSPQHNHLPVSPKVPFLQNGGKAANATDGKITVGGHTVYGIYVTGNANYQTDRTVQTVAYRNNSTKGIATGDQAEAMYMVLDGKRFSSPCCFDYGNAETTGNDDGNGTMEAIYWGSDTLWARGGGNGPWIAADLENGMYKGDSTNTPSNTSITGLSWVTAILKGPSGNHFTLKAGNAQSGALAIKWDGGRPTPNYSPKKLEGAIILGTGGDGSSGGTGTFYEGAMTIGNPSDSIDDAIQANIVALGYGR
jgi:Alpha-L-arabinofuranosidase B, catalytic/Ricin-type beta-trefoil lectin domain-like